MLKRGLISIFLLLLMINIVQAETSVSQNGITWNFDGDYEVGQFYFGDWWVVGPVTITSVSPSWDGIRHGSMLDPDASVEAQGYRVGLDMSYSDSLRVKFPITISGVSSLISTIGLDEIQSGGSHEGLRSAAVLTVVNDPPSEGSFRPPYVDGEKPIYHPSQMRFDLLLRLIPPGDVPTSEYTDAFTKAYIDHSPGGGNRGATIHPIENGPTYGKGFSVQVSHIALLALLDIPEAEEMARKLTQLGIDLYHIYLKNEHPGGGGFNHGRKWPVIFAGLMLDHEGMKNPPLYDVGDINKFVEDRMTTYGAPTSDYPEGKPIWGLRCIDDSHGDSCIVIGESTQDREEGGYRTCCSSFTWVGQALAARLMGTVDLWNHQAFFDYVDRWVSEPESWVYGGESHPGYYGFGGDFVQDMWDTYRYYTPEPCTGYCCPSSYTCSSPISGSCSSGQCCASQSACTSTTQTCSQLAGPSWGCCTGTETCGGTSYSGSSDCSGICCSQACTQGGAQDEIIIDNLESGFTTTGSWRVSGYPSPYGSNAVMSDVNEGSTATWTPSISQAGNYEVYAWWTAGDGRINDAKYTINHAGGSDLVVINQKTNGGQWNYLGTYNFNSGTLGSVSVSDESTDPNYVPGSISDSVCADAVRFLMTEGSACGESDGDGDGVVSISELINYIGEWKIGNVSIGDLIDAIGKWKGGC